MILPENIAKDYLKSYTDVLNSFIKISGGKLNGFVEARDELHKNKDKYNKSIFDNDIRSAINTSRFDNYVVVKLGKRKNVFMDSKDTFHQVFGITQELCDILETWEIINTAVMTYRGYYLCDGLIRHGDIRIGPNMRKEILDSYKNEKHVLPNKALHRSR